MITTERLYYSDSFLREFTAVVNGVREVTRQSGESLWQLSLNSTAFYPTSGGQPFDKGVLRTNSSDGAALEIPVEEVEEDEDGPVWHLVRTPLAVGVRVEGHIDWDRRFDQMQQHTGQHLLSAVFLRELGAPTVSFHLGESTSTIDLAKASLAHPSLVSVERISNELIAEDRPVSICCVSRAEAEAMLAAGELRKLPERQGTIRLIEIADCDRNACGGTHVRSTGQIGGLLIRGVEKVSRGVRVEFVCGLRAVGAARADGAILSQMTALLSTGTADLPAAVGRIQVEAKANKKECQKMREELATFQAEALVIEVPMENGLRLVVRGWKNQSSDYVKLLAARTAAVAPSTAAIFSALDSDPVRLFVARSQNLDIDCGRILREALNHLGFRGGGSSDRAQGEVSAEHEPAVQFSLSDAIRRCRSEKP